MKEIKLRKVNLEKAKAIINEIKEIGELKGTILANRNGDLIAENLGKEFDTKNFAAMCASVLESAEQLGQDVHDQKIGKIIAELKNGQIIIIRECRSEIFFSFVLEKYSKVEKIFKNLEKFCKEILLKNDI